MTDQLLEAAAPSGFLARVQALDPGEVARLEGGVAVKHLALEDARLAYRVARPRSYGAGETRWDDYGEYYRTVEDAVRAAFRASAESTDPDSIGGAERLSRYGPYEVGGQEVRVVGFTLEGQPLVAAYRGDEATGGGFPVKPESLTRRKPQLLAADLQEDAWGGKPGTNFTQVSPENRKKVNPLVRHYMKQAHPFTACVRDNTKRFGAERAKRICAVVKDMGAGTTKWRKGSVQEAEVDRVTERLVEAAGGDAEGVEIMLLQMIAEREHARAHGWVG